MPHMKTNRKSAKSRTSYVISNPRWIAYATAAAASALANNNSAEGAITYSGVIDERFDASPGSYIIGYFSLGQPGNSLIPIHNRFGSPSSTLGAARFALYGAASAALAGFSASGYNYVSRLDLGQRVSAQQFVPQSGTLAVGTLAYGKGYGNDQWLMRGPGFVGFRFNAGSGMQYGWARVRMGSSPVHRFILVDYAFGDVGDRVEAGQTGESQVGQKADNQPVEQVPSSGSVGFLALGAAGLVAWRKRRSS